MGRGKLILRVPPCPTARSTRIGSRARAAARMGRTAALSLRDRAWEDDYQMRWVVVVCTPGPEGSHPKGPRVTAQDTTYYTPNADPLPKGNVEVFCRVG
jgi:hypothetical protein